MKKDSNTLLNNILTTIYNSNTIIKRSFSIFVELTQEFH
jgi:hypothetical protein